VRTFPQQFNLLSVVQADIQDPDSGQNIAWTGNLSSTQISTDQAAWNSYTTAAAALLILTIIWAFGTVAICAAVPARKSLNGIVDEKHIERAYPRYVTFLSLFDAALSIVAAGLWTGAILQAASDYNAPRLFDTYGTINPGPGFWLLWVVCIAKLCVMPVIAFNMFIIVPMLLVVSTCLNCCGGDHGTGACLKAMHGLYRNDV
jgi:hypothetical protein